MQPRHRWFVFGTLCLLLCILWFFGTIVATTASSWIDHLLGTKEDVVTPIPKQHIAGIINWVGLMPDTAKMGTDVNDSNFMVGRPHVARINNEWTTITFQLSSSAPTKSYPELRVFLQDHRGITVREVNYLPDDYPHGSELTVEPVSLTLHVHSGEQRVSVQARKF